MQEKTDYSRGLNAAFRSIARRDCSVHEIRELLRRKEIKPDIEDEIIAVLIRDKYLDDDRFTNSVIRAKKRYNRDGPLKIKQFLIHKGVSESIIDRFLEAGYGEEEEVRTIEELLSRKKIPEKKNLLQQKQYLYNFLMGKGFSPYVIFESIEKHLKNSQASD